SLANDLGFATIREAFMVANSVEQVEKMEDDFHGGIINKQVMRILIPRVAELFKWIEYSEKELKKRYSIETNYLKSQVATIKIYSAWLRPYLKAAAQLRQQGFENHAAMVNAF